MLKGALFTGLCRTCFSPSQDHKKYKPAVRRRIHKGTGRCKTKDGYIWLSVKAVSPSDDELFDSLKDELNRVAEHRFVMARFVGRALTSKETVHHKNGIRDDNRLENLELWTSSHPPGQRIEDHIVWAKQILALYGHLFPLA